MTNNVLDRPDPPTESQEGRNYKTMLGNGISYASALQLANPRTVLPFLSVCFGAPVFIVGLLVPLVQVSRMVAQVVGAPVFGAPERSKGLQVLAYMLMGGALATLGIVSPFASGSVLAILFLCAAIIIGTSQSIISLAWSNMVKRIFSDERRKTLLYTQATLAGLLTTPIALAMNNGVSFANALDSHLVLVWAAAAIILVAGCIMFFVHDSDCRHATTAPNGGDPASKKAGPFLETLRENFTEAVKVPWFRRFLTARILLISIELAPPFYAIHAAAMHKDEAGSLTIFVAVTGVAVVLGGPLWRRISNVSDQLVMLLGAALGGVAGLWALALENFATLRSPLSYSIVFFVLAMAIIGISTARTNFLIVHAPKEQQSYFVGTNSTVGAGLGIVFALVLGAMAQMKGPYLAISVIIALNVIAAIYCIRMPKPETA